MRSNRKVFYTIGTNIISQIVAIFISLVIPKLIIDVYGSEINGVISSSRQIVQYCFILEGGIAAAAGYSLFGLLRQNKKNEINSIFSAVNKFYINVSVVLAIILTLFSLLYPLSISNSKYLSSVIITLLNSIIVILGYFYFNKYNLILFADEKQYIITTSIIVSSILSTIAQIVLIINKVNIILIVGVNTIINICRLIYLTRYIKKRYPYLNNKLKPNLKAIEQKWDAIAINISSAIKVVIPMVVISIFFGFKYVSIFTIYEAVLHIGSSIFNTCSDGLTPTMGRYIDKYGIKNSVKLFEMSNTITIVLTCIISICFYVLMMPFMNLYLGSNAEISYQFPVLSLLLIINAGINNIRFAPNMLIKATGKLKETSKSAVYEVVIAFLIAPLGCLIGFEYVMIGVIISSLYRTIYIYWFCYSKIMKENARKFIDTSLKSISLAIFVAWVFNKMISNDLSLPEFIICAILILLITSILYIIFIIIINRKIFKELIQVLISNRRSADE